MQEEGEKEEGGRGGTESAEGKQPVKKPDDKTDEGGNGKRKKSQCAIPRGKKGSVKSHKRFLLQHCEILSMN